MNVQQAVIGNMVEAIKKDIQKSWKMRYSSGQLTPEERAEKRAQFKASQQGEQFSDNGHESEMNEKSYLDLNGDQRRYLDARIKHYQKENDILDYMDAAEQFMQSEQFKIDEIIEMGDYFGEKRGQSRRMAEAEERTPRNSKQELYGEIVAFQRKYKIGSFDEAASKFFAMNPAAAKKYAGEIGSATENFSEENQVKTEKEAITEEIEKFQLKHKIETFGQAMDKYFELNPGAAQKYIDAKN